jgi:hypothetical protein
MLVLTSPTSDGRSVGIARSRTQATEFFSSLCKGFHSRWLTQSGYLSWCSRSKSLAASTAWEVPGQHVASNTHLAGSSPMSEMTLLGIFCKTLCLQGQGSRRWNFPLRTRPTSVQPFSSIRKQAINFESHKKKHLWLQTPVVYGLHSAPSLLTSYCKHILPDRVCFYTFRILSRQV